MEWQISLMKISSSRATVQKAITHFDHLANLMRTVINNNTTK